VFKPASFEPRWIKPFPPLSNPLWVYGGDSEVHVWDGLLHTDLTRVSGPYTGGPQNRWQGEVFNGVGIFNNGVDIPQMWPGMGVQTKLQDLANWPTDLRARWVRPFGFFLVAGWMIESNVDRPYRVRWSHPAAPGTIPASWALADPTKDSGEIDLAETPDYVVDGLALGDLFMVYKERTVWGMQYVGGSQIFNFWQVLFERGLLWSDCVQAFPGGHFAVGQDDIYVHNGQRGSDKSVVQDRIKKWIFNQIDSDSFYNCFTLVNRSENEIWFCFPESGETFATIALVWNWTTGAWGFRDLPGIPFASAGVVAEETEGDTWGGRIVTGLGALYCSEALFAGESERSINEQPSALQSQAAAVVGLGSTGLPGWPDISDLTKVYTAEISTDGGPIQLSTLALTSVGGGLTPYSAQQSKIILNFASGVDRLGVAGGVNQAGLWLDQLFPGSVVILNLDGVTITGADGALDPENGYPAVLASSEGAVYLKLNSGTLTGGAKSATGVLDGYSLVYPAGSTLFDATTTLVGDTQAYESPTVALSANGLTNYVPNGLQEIGSIIVSTSGLANDKNLRLSVTRVAGDSFVNAVWDRSDPSNQLKIKFTSSGTNRERTALFAATVTDGAGRQVVTGQMTIQAIHGAPNYVLEVDPVSWVEVVHLTGAQNQSGTWSKVFTAQVVGGIGPFLYNWTSSIGTITNGQTTPQITLEQASGLLSAGEDRQFSGNLTLIVTDQGNGNDQISVVVPVVVTFDNSPPFQSINADGALQGQAAVLSGVGVAEVDISYAVGAPTARPATMTGSGSVVPLNPLTLTITPSNVNQSAVGPGTGGTYYHTFTINFQATPGGGTGNYTYAWNFKLGWSVTGQGTATPTAQRTLSAAVDEQSIYNSTVSCTLTDTVSGFQKVVTVPIYLQLTNPRVKQVINGTGALVGQRAVTTGTGTWAPPQGFSVQAFPSVVEEYAEGDSYLFFVGFTSSINGGIGPFTYSWVASLGTVQSPNAANTSFSYTMHAPRGLARIRTGTMTLTVTDTGAVGQPSVQDSVSMTFSLDNTSGGIEP